MNVGERRRHRIMAIIATMIKTPAITPPTMGPMLLDLLAPVVDVSPEPAAAADGSDVDDEGAVKVVLRPEGVGRDVGGIDDALHIRYGLRKERLNDKVCSL